MKRLVTDSLIVFVVFMFLIFYHFSKGGSVDSGTTGLGAMLYLPFALLLTVYNAIVQTILTVYDRPWKEVALTPLAPMVLWVLVSGGSIVIAHWKLGFLQCGVAIVMLGALNLFNHFRQHL